MVGLTAAEIAINRELILLARDFLGVSVGRAIGLFALYTITYTGAMYVLMEFGGDAYDSVRAGIGKALNALNPFRSRRSGASNV
jgi:hypothetical protein